MTNGRVWRSCGQRPREAKEDPFPNIAIFHPLSKGLMSPWELRMIFLLEWGPRRTCVIIQGPSGHSRLGIPIHFLVMERREARRQGDGVALLN